MHQQSNQREIRKIDFIFYNERAIRRKIYETRRDPNPAQLLVKPSNPLIGDPVGNQVIRKLTKLREIKFENGMVLKDPETWIEFIEEAYSRTDEKTKGIAQEFYRNERIERTCSRFGISKSAYYARINRFRQFAMMQAISKSLIKF